MDDQKTIILSAIFFIGLFLLSFILFNYSQKNKARQILFFPEAGNELLLAESRNIPRKKELFHNVKALIEELLIGSSLPGRDKLFPGETKLISVFVVDKTVTINLSYDILKEDDNAPLSLPGILQATVNNLVYNFKSIKKVVFYIEGELLEPEIEKASGDIQKMYIHQFDANLLK